MNALVVGGSNGIGLSIVLSLLKKNGVSLIHVVDKADFPKEYNSNRILFYQCDLSCGDYSIFNKICDIDALYITVGFGHLKYFHELSEEYIQNSFAVNSVAPIQIIRHYYDKLLAKDDFFCAVMVSIAGRLSSPMFSVYSATKAALSKFIEAVNVELEVQGSNNRILEVSPGSLKGTSFTGCKSKPAETENLAVEIISRSENKEILFIPQYEEVFKNVISRYNKDAHKFGIDSYLYKKSRI